MTLQQNWINVFFLLTRQLLQNAILRSGTNLVSWGDREEKIDGIFIRFRLWHLSYVRQKRLTF